MYHEKIVVNDRGQRVQIRVDFNISMDKPSWRVSLSICEKGKRKFRRLTFDDYSYRELSMEGRQKYEEQKFKEVVSDGQIMEAKKELWQMLSPENTTEGK